MVAHRVPGEVFDELAAGGGDLRGVLRAGQRSKRLLLVHEWVSTVRSRLPTMAVDADCERALAVLTDAQRRSPQAADEALLLPHVGAWATRTLRRVLSSGWMPPEDVGHLGAVAAAMALGARMPVEVTAFVRDGTLMLPGLGSVQLGGPSAWCQVRTSSDGRGVGISVGGATAEVALVAGGSHWSPLRRVGSTADGLVIDVVIDDQDPYRGCGHLPVGGRLDAAAVQDWQAKLDDAWLVLVEDHPERAEAIGDGVNTVVPLRPTEAAAELSATCHEAIGAVAMTPPRTSLSLALALVHEFQHTKLAALLDLVPLVERLPGRSFYAPWRADPRPVRGLLQGAYAYLGLAAFWEGQRHRASSREAPADLAQFEFAHARDQVRRALDELERSGALRQAGRRFVRGMRERLWGLAAQPVPSLPQSLARVAGLDHAIGWRLRNLRPDPEQLTAWVQAWVAGRTCPWTGQPVATMVDQGGPAPSAARHALLRQRLAFPDGWAGHPGAPRDPGGPGDVDTANVADVHAVAGRWAEATEAYRRRLEDAPDELAAWSGLALACGQLSSPAAPALVSFPECIHALHQAIRSRCGTAPGPEQLALWLLSSRPPARSSRTGH